MTSEQAAIDTAVGAIAAAVRTGDTAALYESVVPPAGSSTPPDEAARWFGLLLIHLSLAASAASELEPGCSRETLSQWIADALGPAPTPALIRGADPVRIDHATAAGASADYARYVEYAVDLMRIGLTSPDEEVGQQTIAAHQAATNDKTACINVIALLARLAAVPSRHR
ncbi:hypothetical protein TR51_18990 [Kitasatospora griseola]|uniref:Uncharacterized protein n=1 Tax=Kitasatospora griseola TaxID=2064 RepID=A0A0D0Q4F6_KITGR|nr:hypothetical protein [Kitasatospora griseola]KIQ65823.1 hypothetical protein TR51_18990 [Kitasatospora griseola]